MKKRILSGRVAKHGLPRGGKNLDKRNVVLELESLKAWVAQGGGKNFDKRNVVLELESLKTWVAKGGENLIKGMLSGRVAKHGLPRKGKILIKGMLYLYLNH